METNTVSRGKYSPNLPEGKQYVYNCYGQLPAPWTIDVRAAGVQYDEKTMFANYDDEGYDSYGYSCFDQDGNYVGIGSGVDRNGYTEYEYMCMDDDTFSDFS